MNSLKFALSAEESSGKNRDKGEVNGSLLKGVNKNKAERQLALVMDSNDQVTEQSLNNDHLLRILHEKIDTAFRKESKSISQVTFERIIEEFQDEAGSQNSELAYLMVIEDKLTDIYEFAKEELKSFLDIFNDILQAKIAKLRKKEKKIELNNFDSIVDRNFKKKTESKNYLNVDEPKIAKRSREKQNSRSLRRNSGSADKKLNKLFSKDKNPLKESEIKEAARKGEEHDRVNATADISNDESVSFSSVLTNVTVKTRKRKGSNDYKRDKHKKIQEKAGDKDKDEGNEAFMFFRPKKDKKND